MAEKGRITYLGRGRGRGQQLSGLSKTYFDEGELHIPPHDRRFRERGSESMHHSSSRHGKRSRETFDNDENDEKLKRIYVRDDKTIIIKEQKEKERRDRMDRLRAEIEEEERNIAEAKWHKEKASFPKKSAKDSIVTISSSEIDGLDEEEQMKLMLGFSGGFESTKNKKVEDNHKTAARGTAAKNKARKYRQYMNRKGGFNRPLDKMS